MFRSETFDNRVWTVGGANSALYGDYRTRYQNGVDRTPGSGQSEEHEYHANHYHQSCGYFKWVSKSNPLDYGWSVYSPVFGSAEWDSNDDLALIGKLRVLHDQTSFNGGNFLGELPQTVGLLGGKVKLLAGVLAAVSGIKKPRFQRYRRGKRVPPRKKNRVTGDSLIADSWLEFSFGVRPLIDDIHEIAKIAANQNVIRTTLRVRRQGRPGKITSPWPYAVCTGSRTISKQIIAKLEQEELPTFWEQFGLADPATVPWELLPWSFVVDWVLPVGKFIEAQSFARRVKGTFITTTKQVTDWNMSVTSHTDLYYNINMLSERGHKVTIDRTVASSLGVPLPAMKSNLLGGKPLERLANALSLVAQVFK